MCGIFGLLGSLDDGEVGETESSTNDVTAHRGPDDYDSFVTSYDGTDVYLDHNRLSIIGLGPQGRQPFRTDDDSIALVYNGEIYNYKTLKETLATDHDCEFETTTDTEVLLKAYQTWDIDRVLEELVGMFAFGAINLDEGVAHVVRDHLGVKPVYYANGESLLFGSEAKALLQKGGVEARLDENVLGEYLANFWVHEPDTLFEDIAKLEAGHYLTYDLETEEVDKTEYWDIVDDGGNPDVSELDDDLETVVQDQLVSDVPLGMYLSGGIDSSIVAYHATNEQPLTALNLRNDTEEVSGEYQNLERLAAQLDIGVESFDPDASMLDVYRQMVYHMDEPIADPAIIPANLLAQEARERDTKVMLSGMGGDELFAGYKRMRVISNADWLAPLSPLVSLAHRLFPSRDSRFRRNLGRVARFLRDTSPSNYFSLAYYFSRQEITNLTGDNAWYDRYRTKINDMLANREFVDDAQRYQYLDIRGYLASHNLLYMDKASMADSVEVRVPLLDHRFAGKYFNLPTDEKLADGLKTPLKDHLADALGQEFVGHDKQGFSFPVEDYLEDDLRDDLRTMLNDDRFARAIDTQTAEQILDDHFAGRADNGMKIWALYTLWLWLDTFDVAVK